MGKQKRLIDLRGIECPINFVKTKLLLDTMEAGDLLNIWLDEGEPAESVTASVQAEGHQIINQMKSEEGYYLTVQKSKSE